MSTTFSTSSYNNNDNNNINNINNINDKNFNFIYDNNNSTVILGRKHTTRACITCKQRHKKCTGIQPCNYCIARNQSCVFDSQDKRGPKPKKAKVNNNNNNNNNTVYSREVVAQTPFFNEATLWIENERSAAVDSFFELRLWWSYLLDPQGIKKSSSIILKAQNLVISAHMSRFHKNKTRSLELFESAMTMMTTVEEEEGSLEHASCLMLMIDFRPSLFDIFTKNAWAILQKAIKPGLPEIRNTRMYSYIKMMYFSGIDCMDTRKAMCYEMEQDLLRQPTAEPWDIVFAILTRIGSVVFADLPCCTDTRFLDYMKNFHLKEDALERVLNDLTMIQWIVTCNPVCFGIEIFWFYGLKPLLLWKKGDTNGALTETMKYINTFSSLGPKQFFLVDILGYVAPFLVLQALGMGNLLRESLDLLAPIDSVQVAFATDQHELYAQILDYFLPKSKSTFSIPPTNTDFHLLIPSLTLSYQFSPTSTSTTSPYPATYSPPLSSPSLSSPSISSSPFLSSSPTPSILPLPDDIFSPASFLPQEFDFLFEESSK